MVDTPVRTTVEGGAVILVDDDLDVASLRMFNEAERAADYRVRVSSASGGAAPLADQVRAAIDVGAGVWQRFSGEVAAAIEVRAKFLRQEIAGGARSAAD